MQEFDEYEVLGRRFLVGSPVPEARTAIHQLLRGFGPVPLQPGGDVPRFRLTREDGTWFVYGEHGPVHGDADLLPALGMLEWHVMTAALERHHDLFHLHGAAVAAPTGRGAVVLAGNSGCGKSTLTLALMQRGFLAFADDLALIEPATANVRTFRRAFHTSDDSLRLVEGMIGRAVASGGAAPAGFFHPPAWAAAPARVRWILLLELAPGQRPGLTRMTPADAAVGVLEQALNLKQAPQVGLAAAARLTIEAECYRFRHGDVAESVAMVEKLAG